MTSVWYEVSLFRCSSSEVESLSLRILTKFPVQNCSMYQPRLLWAPIPILSWFIPFIGHLGLEDSQGNSYDWIGLVNQNNFCFGRPVRYALLPPISLEAWDNAIETSISEYQFKLYTLHGCNCHHFTQSVIRRAYGKQHLLSYLALYSWLKSSYFSLKSRIRTYIPIFVIYLFIIWLFFL
ncbi:hypothetical protein RCL1_008148 [Eukaryota sp. TZLM3-RCL]